MTPEEKRQEKIKILEMLDPVVKEKEKRHFRERFYEFNKEVIGWPDIYEPLHKKVCDFIQDNIEKRMCLLLLPRGTFKSSIVTVGYSLWQIARDPATRGLIANATYPMATSFLGQVKKNLQQNNRFKELYGDLATDAPIWREDAFAVAAAETFQSKEPTVSAVGVKSNYTGTHFDWAILDDLVNRDNIRTMDRISEVINFYKDVLDLVDPSPAGHKRIIVIGTTWHQADLYSWIRDPDTGIIGDFAVMRLPAFGTFDDNDRFSGVWGESELLFPTRLTWEVMENLKRSQGNSHFSAQYLLDPVPPGDAKFKNFKFYEPADLKGVTLNKFVAVDPAIGEDKSHDFSAMVCVGVDYLDNWYVLDIWRDRVNPKRLIDQIMYWDAKHKPITTAIEATAFQRTIQFFLREEMKRSGRNFPITELRHTDRSKEERIEGLQPKYEAGMVFHHKDHPLEKYLRDELSRFPRSKNDDLSDAMASINEVAFPPRKRERRNTNQDFSYYPA
jgi:predicted phage terminase large subunit-like protein